MQKQPSNTYVKMGKNTSKKYVSANDFFVQGFLCFSAKHNVRIYQPGLESCGSFQVNRFDRWDVGNERPEQNPEDRATWTNLPGSPSPQRRYKHLHLSLKWRIALITNFTLRYHTLIMSSSDWWIIHRNITTKTFFRLTILLAIVCSRFNQTVWPCFGKNVARSLICDEIAVTAHEVKKGLIGLEPDAFGMLSPWFHFFAETFVP